MANGDWTLESSLETESSLKLLSTFPEPFDGHTPRRATGEAKERVARKESIRMER